MKETDEVNLAELVDKFFTLIKNNISKLLIYTILGVASGVLLFIVLPNKYTGYMMIESKILKANQIRQIIKPLNFLLEENDKNQLMNKFHLKKEEAQNIKKINVGTFKNNSHIVLIEAEVLNKKMFPIIQTAILKYLEENPYVKNRIDRKKHLILSSLENLDQEIQTLKKLEKNLILNSLENSDQEIRTLKKLKENTIKKAHLEMPQKAFFFNPTVISARISFLLNQKRSLSDSLSFMHSVQIIDNFVQKKTHFTKKLSLFILIGTSLGFLVGFIFCSFSTPNTKNLS